MRRANARNAAWHDLAALGDERLKHPDVLVIDVVDLLDAETANLLAPEILFLSDCGGFIATGRALRSRNRAATSWFRHYEFSFVSTTAGSVTGAPGAGWA